MRHVYPASQVIDLWCKRAQDEAHTPSKNLYFNGPTIFSYGSHFPMAQFRSNDKGAECVIVTTDTYSKTTAKHMHWLKMAIDRYINLPVFPVPDVPVRVADFLDVPLALMAMQQRYEKAMLHAGRVRLTWTKRYAVEGAERNVRDYNGMAAFFGSDNRLEWPTDVDATIAAIKQEHNKLRNEKILRGEGL